MSDEERFDPSRHGLDDAAKRLKEISEKDYTSRIAHALGEHDEETNEPEVTGAIPESVLAFSRDDGGSAEYVDLPHGTALTLSSCKVTFTASQYSEECLRTIVAETISAVLYPEQDGTVGHQHRRVRQWDEDGTEWRGVLYRVEKESEL